MGEINFEELVLGASEIFNALAHAYNPAVLELSRKGASPETIGLASFMALIVMLAPLERCRAQVAPESVAAVEAVIQHMKEIQARNRVGATQAEARA